MKIKTPFLCSIAILLLSSCNIYKSYNDLKIERLRNPEKDNNIYSINKLFRYNYDYIKDDNHYLMRFTNEYDTVGYYKKKGEERPVLSSKWELIEKELINTQDSNLVSNFTFRIKAKNKLRANTGQTNLKIRLENSNLKELPGGGLTGIVENEYNVWSHPPRTKLFKILQLNPYPFAKLPLEEGKTYYDDLKIGNYWADKRWIEPWEGSITTKMYYTVGGFETIQTLLGDIECRIINAKGESELGETALKIYFNETYGFVRLEYVNIDKSRMNIQLIEIEQ